MSIQPQLAADSSSDLEQDFQPISLYVDEKILETFGPRYYEEIERKWGHFSIKPEALISYRLACRNGDKENCRVGAANIYKAANIIKKNLDEELKENLKNYEDAVYIKNECYEGFSNDLDRCTKLTPIETEEILDQHKAILKKIEQLKEDRNTLLSRIGWYPYGNGLTFFEAVGEPCGAADAFPTES